MLYNYIFENFYWRIIALQYCVDFCHTSTWISHRYTCVLSILNLLPSPTPSHPSRLSQSTGLSSLHHTANSHWLSVLYRVMYMFQCCSLTSSHPPLPLLCPQVFLWVSTAALQKTHHSRFHLYVLMYDICFSLSDLTSLCITCSRWMNLGHTPFSSSPKAIQQAIFSWRCIKLWQW